MNHFHVQVIYTIELDTGSKYFRQKRELSVTNGTSLRQITLQNLEKQSINFLAFIMFTVITVTVFMLAHKAKSLWKRPRNIENNSLALVPVNVDKKRVSICKTVEV